MPWLTNTAPKLSLTAAGVLFCATTLSAGVVFQATTTHHQGEDSRTESVVMSSDGTNLKMEIQPGETSRSGPNDEVVFRGAQPDILAVNHRDRSYMVMSTESLGGMNEDIQAQMKEAMGEVREHLDELDPKQRAMVEKMLGEQMGAAGLTGEGDLAGATLPRSPGSTYTKTTEKVTHSGFPCVRWDVERDGQKVRELWVTDWDNIEGSKQVRKAFGELGTFMDELLESVTGGWASGFAENNPFEAFARIDGFPVVSREFEGGTLTTETVLESVTERDLDPDAFEPPAGYKLRTMGPQ